MFLQRYRIKLRYLSKKFSSDTRSFNETEYLNISNNDKVYVITSVLNHFVVKILPN